VTAVSEPYTRAINWGSIADQLRINRTFLVGSPDYRPRGEGRRAMLAAVAQADGPPE
jgi:hypothetical protein